MILGNPDRHLNYRKINDGVIFSRRREEELIGSFDQYFLVMMIHHIREKFS